MSGNYGWGFIISCGQYYWVGDTEYLINPAHELYANNFPIVDSMLIRIGRKRKATFNVQRPAFVSLCATLSSSFCPSPIHARIFKF